MTTPPSEPPENRPVAPAWRAFLTPGAILLGACIIAAAVFITNSSDDDGASSSPGDDAVATEATPASGGDAPATLLAALNSYAEDLDLDADAFDQCLADTDRAQPIGAHLEVGNALGVTGTPTFFINDKMIVGAQPTEIFLEVIERELDGPPASIDEYSESVQALAATDPPRFAMTGEDVDVSGAEVHGDSDAPVMVAEFSDFQCPFCQRWVQQSMEPVRDVLGDDVGFAFMHFPIAQIHPNAPYASFAAICAGEQDSFWEMHDLLFERQAQWAELPPN